VIGVLLDQRSSVTAVPMQLPLPRDPRAHRQRVRRFTHGFGVTPARTSRCR
jgi:hypothetical protein